MQLLLVLLILFLEMRFLQVEFLLKLIDSDLELYPAFPLPIIRLEQVKLKAIILLPEPLTLLSQVCFDLLALQ